MRMWPSNACWLSIVPMLGRHDLELLHHGRDQKLHHRGAGGSVACRIGLDGVDDGGLSAHAPERRQPPGPLLARQTARVLWRTRRWACPPGLFLAFFALATALSPTLRSSAGAGARPRKGPEAPVSAAMIRAFWSGGRRPCIA